MKTGGRTLSSVSWLTLGFLYAPLFVLVLFSFNDSRYGGSWHGFTWRWYAELFADEEILGSALNSLLVAAVSTALAVTFGTAAAVARDPRRKKSFGLGDGLLYLPLIIPELMLAVGFLLFFGVLRWELGLASLIAAHTTLNLPIVWLIVWARLEKLDPRLEDAALDLGATRWIAFWKVTLPLLMPSVVAGGLMAFVISLDCFVLSFFVSGPEATTLPIQIYSMLKFAISPEVNALSTILFVACVALVIVAWLLQGGESAT